MPARPGMRTVAAQFPVELADWLDALAAEEDRTMAQMLRHIVRRYREEKP